MENWVRVGLPKVFILPEMGDRTCPYKLQFYLIHAPRIGKALNYRAAEGMVKVGAGGCSDVEH